MYLLPGRRKVRKKIRTLRLYDVEDVGTNGNQLTLIKGSHQRPPRPFPDAEKRNEEEEVVWEK